MKQNIKKARTTSGVVIKVEEIGGGIYRDVQTGTEYCQHELHIIPPRHDVQLRCHIGRLGFALYAREYIKYHSWQFGLTIDAVNGYDRYVDVELRAFCFGIGIRFIWIKRNK